MRIIISLATISLIGFAVPVRAGEPIDLDFFEKKVRPILAIHCVSCHGPNKQKANLRLDLRAGFVRGGESGPLVTPGEPDRSLLLQVIRYDGDIKMPQKGKLADSDIATLTAWVKGGAPWPDDQATGGRDSSESFDVHVRAKAHWAFQPVKRPAVPVIRQPAAVIRNDLDRFVLAKLSENGLSFTPPADKRTLLRRVYFDLIGLPPTPQELEAFLKDDSPNAYEQVVERLLASPHYGERWGRHWLDLVRYAESHGHEFDFDIPDAWRYRDYVIRAFNADVPFNQFLTEHIAGDLLPNPRRNPKDGSNESLLATAFWWLGEAKHSPVDSRAEQADRVDNQIDVFGKAFLGLTLACARCHDHKFDPVSTRDYYALFGVLASSRFNQADIDDPTPTTKLLDELKQLRAQLKEGRREPTLPVTHDQSRSTGLTVFELFDASWRSRWDAEGLAFRPEAGNDFPHSGREARKLSGALRSPTFTIEKPFLAIRVAGRNGRARVILNGLQLIQNPIYGGLAQPVNHGEELQWMVFDLTMWKGQRAYLELLDDGPGFIAIREAWFTDSPPAHQPGPNVPIWDPPVTNDPAIRKLIERIQAIESQIPDARRAPTIRDGTGINERVFIRGNHKTLGAEVPRGFLEVFGSCQIAGSGSGRLELAKAVTDPANPLVARVIVNRLWKHHFGEGIVRTPDDFGKQGQPPTHPELLDWLAAELVHPTNTLGTAETLPWSLKHLHRLMVLSMAYQQSSRTTPEQAVKAATIDPQNRLLHRQNVRRLEAEAIRDSILLISGRLDRTMEGPSILPYLTDHQVGRGRPASGPLDGHGRRSIYLAVRRNFLNPMFTAFDYPTPFTTIGRRTVSNVPAQALVMLNNPFVLQQADLWAKRVLAQPALTAQERVSLMYESAFGRKPTVAELTASLDFLTEQAGEFGHRDHPKAWAGLAHVLFNAKEFLFVE